MIYTSYFSQMHRLPERFPDGFATISIAGRAPSWYKGASYKTLAPKFWFYIKYKQDHDSNFYTEQYYKEVLNDLVADKVVQNCYYLTRHRAGNIVLLCYENPNEFCHRHLVREWLNHNNIKCEEVIF